MGSLSIWHWLIVLAVVLVLFGGRGRVSQVMGDFGKGLKAFKKSMREDEEPMADDERERAETKRPMTALPPEPGDQRATRHGALGIETGDGIGDPLKDAPKDPAEGRDSARGS